MSWRDRIDEAREGTFRGARFFVTSAENQGGRRTVVHEYPQRDRPYTEDLGRRAREWRVEVFVAGDDYDLERDALIEALERKGPGTLVHPYVGTVRASVTDARWRESTRDGGTCTFSLTFQEAGEAELPTREIDTQRAASRAADDLEQALIADFADNWSVEGLVGWSFAAVERDLGRAMDRLSAVAQDVAGDVAAEIRAPANMAGILVGGFNELSNIVTEPLRAIRLYRDLGDFGRSTTVDARTPERRQRQVNQNAMARLIGRAAAASAARAATAAEWNSRDDALIAQRDALELIDAQVETDEPVPHDVYAACRELRVRVSEDLRRRATALPGLITHTPQATLPAIIIAHRLYGDASRDQEVVDRNHVRHPGAIRGGTRLEVLSE